MPSQSVKAEPKERMIEVKVRFFTNSMTDTRGYVRPKHAWTNGSVQMDRNKSHGIEPGNPVLFNSLMEIMPAIEKILIKQGVILHRVRRMTKYVE